MMMGYKYYNQRDYGGTYGGGPFADYACGPTSDAMIAHKRHIKWTPKTVAEEFTRLGKAQGGTIWDASVEFAEQEGYEAEMFGGWKNQYGIKNGSIEKAWKKKMQEGPGKGKLLMGPSLFTTGGHYITIIDIKRQADGTYLYHVWDPYSRNLCRWFPWSTFNGKVKQFYYIDPAWERKSSTKSLDGYKCGKTYKAVSNRPIRTGHSPAKKKTGTLKKGKTVEFVKLYRGPVRLWGKTADGKWLCIKRNDGAKTYIK